MMVVCGGCKVMMKLVGFDVPVYVVDGVPRIDRVIFVDEYMCKECGAVFWKVKFSLYVSEGDEVWWIDRSRCIIDGRRLEES